MGERLYEYDIRLTDYAVCNVVGNMSDRRFAERVERWICKPNMIGYLRRRHTEGNVRQEGPIFTAAEMDELVGAFEDGLDRRYDWVPWESLHRQYIETIGEVKKGLTPQTAEEWAKGCAAYAAQLESDRISLHAGLEIIAEWVRRLRKLQLAMDDERFVPAADWPAPTAPIPPPDRGETRSVGSGNRGRVPRQKADVERMRAAIRAHAGGRTAKPATLIQAAGIANQRGRRALRELEDASEYYGFQRSAPRIPNAE